MESAGTARLGDPGGLRDVVHRRCVVALRGEDLVGGIKQLHAPLIPWQAGSPVARRLFSSLAVTGSP